MSGEQAIQRPSFHNDQAIRPTTSASGDGITVKQQVDPVPEFRVIKPSPLLWLLKIAYTFAGGAIGFGIAVFLQRLFPSVSVEDLQQMSKPERMNVGFYEMWVQVIALSLGAIIAMVRFDHRYKNDQTPPRTH